MIREIVKDKIFMNEQGTLACVKDVDTGNWFVLDKGSDGIYSKLVFGPSDLSECKIYLENN